MAARDLTEKVRHSMLLWASWVGSGGTLRFVSHRRGVCVTGPLRTTTTLEHLEAVGQDHVEILGSRRCRTTTDKS